MQLAPRARPVARISLAVFLQIKCKPLASHSQRVSNSHPNRILEGRKCFPRGTTSTLGASKIEPKSSRGLPGAPKSAQEPPKSAQERPKSAPRAPKRAPRAAKRRPREAQGLPKRGPRGSKKGPKCDPRGNQAKHRKNLCFFSYPAWCGGYRGSPKIVKNRRWEVQKSIIIVKLRPRKPR